MTANFTASMTPVEHWAVVCADRSLRDLPYKIETNRFHQIVISPEICVEVVSPSSCREELNDKMNLYFARGASEVWLCDEEGHMSFFTSDHPGEPTTASRLCPAFPATITID